LEIALYILALQWLCCAETCNQKAQKKKENEVKKKIWLAAVGIVACLLLQIPASSQSSISLTGIVSSAAEGPMEGVVVSAKRVGGRVTVSVVSDRKGRYAFPADRLAAGEYEIRIRAIEYDAANPNMTASVKKEKATRADIKLNKIQDLTVQLSSAEWLMSIPGTQEQKEKLFVVCMTCHKLAPIFKSTYNADQWKTTLLRMYNWSQASSFNKPILSPNRERARPGDEEFAQYLSTINLSGKSAVDFPLKTLPRPRGGDTKVIITEYDLPRSDAEPHDAAVDRKGLVWYCDYAEGIIGRLDPRSGETKEWLNPKGRAGYPGGYQSLELDKDDNPWGARHEFNGVAMFDRKTEQFVNWSLPQDSVSPRTRTTFLAPNPDGTVWIKNDVDHKAFRLNPSTGQFAGYDQFPLEISFARQSALPANFPNDLSAQDKSAPQHNIYGIGSDSLGNEYGADILGDTIAKVDAKTGKATLYQLPQRRSGPRRFHVDAQDRLWIGEFYGNRLGMLDTKTGEIREWSHPIAWYGPYDAAVDKEGNIWTGSMSTDFITRLNPKTGKFNLYLLPLLGSNVRRVDVDNSGPRPVFWVGENHQAKIARVEPLE
jgi:virginiamycin B lyase